MQTQQPDARAEQAEYERVRSMMDRNLRTMAETGGDPELFAAFLLRAAIELNVQLHGMDKLMKAVSAIGVDMLTKGDTPTGKT